MEVAGLSGKSVANRSGLLRALELLEGGQATILLAAKLDRLSRSVVDFATLLDRPRRGHWGLIALDLGADTTTPAGELVANVMAAVAQWERRAIGQRTREGLAVKKAAGVRLGRPTVIESSVVDRIATERADGATLAAIAGGPNGDRVATARGGDRWWPSAVAAALRSHELDAVAARAADSNARVVRDAGADK